jgi:peptide/nickel transport system substrate-binding protein
MRRFAALALAAVLAASGAEARPLVVCDDVTEPLHLDPLRVFTEKSYNLLQQIFDGLVHFDADGRIVPALATSWEQVDPVTVRFRLRPGVRFHNGEPFDAASVRFTLQRHLDPAAGFPGLGFIATIKDAVVVDPLTVDIVTVMPDSLLLRRLAGFVLVLPPKAYGDPGFGRRPVGTGPYRFAEWVPGQRVTLERNAEYWNYRQASPDGLVFRFVPAEQQLELLLKGDLDLVTDLPGTATLRVSENSGTKVVKKEAFYTVSATFDTSEGPLRDLRVRQAINHAVNKQELIRYDLMGNGRVIAGLSMPGEAGHNPDLEPYAYDPKKARQLLKEAGFDAPVRLTALIKVQGGRTAGILKQHLKNVGLELDIADVTTDADALRKLAAKEVDMGITGLADVMGHLFFPQSIVLYSRSPFSLNNDPEYDRRLEAMVVELDPAKHEKLARELDAYVHAQALSIFTYQQIRTYGVSRKVEFVPTVTGRLYCHRISVSGN